MDKASNQDNIAEMVGLAGGEDTQGNTCDTGWGCGGAGIIIGMFISNGFRMIAKIFLVFL